LRPGALRAASASMSGRTSSPHPSAAPPRPLASQSARPACQPVSRGYNAFLGWVQVVGNDLAATSPNAVSRSTRYRSSRVSTCHSASMASSQPSSTLRHDGTATKPSTGSPHSFLCLPPAGPMDRGRATRRSVPMGVPHARRRHQDRRPSAAVPLDLANTHRPPAAGLPTWRFGESLTPPTAIENQTPDDPNCTAPPLRAYPSYETTRWQRLRASILRRDGHDLGPAIEHDTPNSRVTRMSRQRAPPRRCGRHAAVGGPGCGNPEGC
jgi:hypothetical protein